MTHKQSCLSIQQIHIEYGNYNYGVCVRILFRNNVKYNITIIVNMVIILCRIKNLTKYINSTTKEIVYIVFSHKYHFIDYRLRVVN